MQILWHLFFQNVSGQTGSTEEAATAAEGGHVTRIHEKAEEDWTDLQREAETQWDLAQLWGGNFHTLFVQYVLQYLWVDL